MDGELTVEEAGRIERHLESCHTCNAEYESLLYAYELVSAARQLDSSPASWRDIQTRLQAASDHRSWLSRLLLPHVWLPAGAVGILALAVGSVFWYLPYHNQRDRSVEMRQVLHKYMQERELDLQRKGVILRDTNGARTLSFVQYNPFRNPDRRPGGNPFKAE
jgi:hypothetical protein